VNLGWAACSDHGTVAQRGTYSHVTEGLQDESVALIAGMMTTPSTMIPTAGHPAGLGPVSFRGQYLEVVQ
jgi:hypothetical protein